MSPVRLALPETVARTAARLRAAGHCVYLVGGAVRDALLGRTPHDHDLATDATPDVVAGLFPRAKVDDAAFGRVLVGDVDVLTLRRESQYKDRRRPSQVVFTRSVRADLARRDFTVNAMAVDLGASAAAPDGAERLEVDGLEGAAGTLIDPFNGRRDLELGILRAVGPAGRRMAEDALRVLRAVRLRAELGFSYHPALAAALADAGARGLLAHLSAERVRDELSRILVAPGCGEALRDLQRHGLLATVLPECLPMIGCEQHNPMHLYDVWEHSVRAAQAVRPTLALRWAALLHDVAKPACRTLEQVHAHDGTPGLRTHFYQHEVVGSDIARAVLRRLRYPEALVARVCALVRHHMFSYGPETKPGAARRLVLALGVGGAFDLLELRRADRQAARWPAGYGRDGERLLMQLRALQAARERFELRDLAVGGREVMEVLGIPPGPRVGRALREMHQLVLDDALPNRREELLHWLEQERERLLVEPQGPGAAAATARSERGGAAADGESPAGRYGEPAVRPEATRTSSVRA